MTDLTIEILNKQIGGAISERRREKDMRQQDVASACGISRSSMANIEKGRQSISLALLYKISATLGVDDARSFLPKRLPLGTKSAADIDLMPVLDSTESVSDAEREAIQRIIAGRVQGTTS